MIGNIDKKTPVSSYQPSQEVADLTKVVKKAYTEGIRILNKSWVELNDRSIENDQNRGQMMFNSYVNDSTDDPAEEWKWRGTRSVARNKGVAMHAQLTANFLIPLFIAQNDSQEVDKDMSEIMNDIIEWLIQPINSDYQSSFIQIVFSMLTNPVTYLGAEYCEVMQNIKNKDKDSKYTTKEIVDEVLSGFKTPIYSASQILITNAYIRNIQKQKCIIERRWVEYQEMEAKYGDHPNWIFVQTGIKTVYNDDNGLFYDIRDDEHEDLIAEEIYKNRREDIEVPFINGIYMGDSDVDNNPIKHRDNRNAPKYNKVPFGYCRIGEHFFYYKSMMNVLSWDNMLYDAMQEAVMNRVLLEIDMPIAISGSDAINSEIVFPKAVITFEDANAKVSPLLPPSNMATGFNALRETEKSMNNESISETMSGQLPQASQKAYSVAQARADAKKILGGVGKSLSESMIRYGDLMKDIIINNITVPQVEKLVNGRLSLKYPSFFLENKASAGTMSNKVIKFDTSLLGVKFTKEEKIKREMRLLEEIDYPKNKKSITLVNPELFANFKYLCKIDLAEMFNKTNEFRETILMALRQQFANDPYINMLELDKKLVYAVMQSDGDDLIKEEPQQPQLPTGADKVPDISNQLINQTQQPQIQGNVVQ